MRINPRLVSPALSILYKLWVQTLRYDHEGTLMRIGEAMARGRPVLMTIWHEELFALTGFGWQFLRGHLATLASDSRDGELITQVLERMGYQVARGSSTRGGLKAIAQLRRHLQAGRIAVLTVDGPRGPRRKAKEGALYLAQKAGALLFPVHGELSSKRVFPKSWDHFQLPMPFAACRVTIGPALDFASPSLRELALPSAALLLEQALNALAPE